ncbi:MAG: hypothetical protein KDE26_29365 [Bacteroidetes bacterium]|nr:hypothetical protein [Bacteroidota bacterium]
MKTILQYLQQYQRIVLLILVGLWILYAQNTVKEAVARPATTWMNVYSYKDFGTEEKVREYLRDLRTGIAPVFSYLEITSYNSSENIDWVIKGLYQKGIILAFLLPVFLVRRKWWEYAFTLIIGVIFVESTLLIHPGNPQLYDVWLPAFLLAYILFSRISFGQSRFKPINILAAILAGFALSMAELSRPFLLLIIPFLLAYNFYHYRKTAKQRFLYFLIPFLLFSGLWHAKLLVYNHGQVFWSNHGGANLANAWAPIMDVPAMERELSQEAPPVNNYGWAKTNLNTQVHADNGKIRQKHVFRAIFQKPGAAIGLFFKKMFVFTAPQTGMYGYNPEGTILIFYRVIVKLLFFILGFLIIWAIMAGIRNWRFFTSEDFLLIFLTAFLCFIPIIGEYGEESRFLISVLPFLTLTGIYGIRTGYSLVQNYRKKVQ